MRKIEKEEVRALKFSFGRIRFQDKLVWGLLSNCLSFCRNKWLMTIQIRRFIIFV